MKKLITALSALAGLAGVYALSTMAWLKEPLRGVRVFEDYVAAALTAGTVKKEWVVDQPCELIGVRIDSGAAGVGAGSSTIDINKNGVTMFTTKPTIPTASTGDWTVAPADVATNTLKAGDVLSYDVDAIPATSGHTRTKISIIAIRR